VLAGKVAVWPRFRAVISFSRPRRWGVFLLALVPEISTPLPDLLYTGPLMPWYRTGKLLEIAT
jgi:hypothetical protein